MPFKVSRKRQNFWLGVLLFGQLGDLITTAIVLASNGVEDNPIARATLHMGGWPVLILIKLCIWMALYFLVRSQRLEVSCEGVGKNIWRVSQSLAILMVAVSASNILTSNIKF